MARGLDKGRRPCRHVGGRASSHRRRPELRQRRLRCEPLEDRRLLAVLLVDADATPGGNGQAWESAFHDLQDALTQAATLNADGDDTNDVDAIWIAEGTYTPSARLARISHQWYCAGPPCMR